MRNTFSILVLLLVGGGTGALLTLALSAESSERAGRGAGARARTEERIRAGYDSRIADLEAEIARLKALLAARGPVEEAAPDPWANDTPEKVEQLLQDAFAENNVDWLLEVIERLLRMGERGYPILRRMLEDIIFRGKFLPAESDFRMDQLYKLGRIFANQERAFIGFLDYLLNDPQTNPWFKQGALMGAAFYVGSKAPGAEHLQETLMRLFLEQGAGGVPPGILPGNVGKRMQIFAMAMSGDPKMIQPLRDELNKTKDKRMQSDILGALAYLGDPKALPLIQERLDPMEGDHRAEIRALGRLDTEESHEAAERFLRAIPDSKRFYSHAGTYLRSGGGTSAVLLIRERIQANPKDPAAGTAVGTLRRYPTKESYETLVLIRDTAPDQKTAERAAKAAEEVDRRLRGEIPPLPDPQR